MFPGFLFCYVSIWEGIIATLTHDFFPPKSYAFHDLFPYPQGLDTQNIPWKQSPGCKTARRRLTGECSQKTHLQGKEEGGTGFREMMLNKAGRETSVSSREPWTGAAPLAQLAEQLQGRGYLTHFVEVLSSSVVHLAYVGLGGELSGGFDKDRDPCILRVSGRHSPYIPLPT